MKTYTIQYTTAGTNETRAVVAEALEVTFDNGYAILHWTNPETPTVPCVVLAQDFVLLSTRRLKETA